MELARCDYINRNENIIAVGNSGTGKSHIALGFGLAACQKGLAVGTCSNASIRRATVGWARPSCLDAVKVEPVRTTARKTLISDQLSKAFFIFVEQHNVKPNTSGILNLLVDSPRQKSLGLGFPSARFYATILDAYRNIIHGFIGRPQTA